MATETRGIQGHLRLVCGLDGRGISSLREQSFRAPIHLSKPHWDSDALVLNVINPTAGLLEGDRITQDVLIQKGGRLILTSPSASRAHRVRHGWAELVQTFHVEEGAFFELLPEIFIPQAGAHYRQTTIATLDAGAEMFLWESIAPGRVASGESFAYQRLDWHSDISLAGHLQIRERYQIEPDSPECQALRRAFPHAYYGSLVAISPLLERSLTCWEEFTQRQSPQLWIGVSPLAAPGAWSVKWLAQDAPTSRAIQEHLRQRLYAATGKTAPDLRRITGH